MASQTSGQRLGDAVGVRHVVDRKTIDVKFFVIEDWSVHQVSIEYEYEYRCTEYEYESMQEFLHTRTYDRLTHTRIDHSLMGRAPD